VRGPLEFVDEDGAADTELIAEPLRGGDLVLEGLVVAEVLARVRLTRVEEDPRGLGVAISRTVQQRTLRRAVRSGERAELDDERL
jgi:hypothetical protein